MTRIRFEDLPSRNTPRNAENLNKLNNVVISPTEPTTGEEVWIKSGGKNLFDKSKATLQYLALKDSGTLTYAEKMAVSDYIIVEKLESIILSGMTNELSNGGAFYDSSKTYISGFTLNEILAGVSVPSNAKYVRVNTSIEELDITQLEEGLVVTAFEAYVDKEIYVKNDKGVYELFDKVESPQYCQVQIDGNRILKFNGTEYEKVLVPFERITTKSGNFTLEGNGIKIPKGISKIKVSTNMSLSEVTAATMFSGGIYASDVAKAFSVFYVRSLDVISNTWIVDVKEGDIITFAFQNQSAAVNSIKLYGNPDRVTTSMLIEKIA